MSQTAPLIFGDKSLFAIEVSLQPTPMISFYSEAITQNSNTLFSVSPFDTNNFLSCMSTAWGRLFLEQTYPFVSEKTVFNPQHFVYINKDELSKSEDVQSFENAHNIGKWLNRSESLYLMRQGNFIEITFSRKVFAFSMQYISELLTSFGNYLSDNFSDTDSSLWNNRENISKEDLLFFISGDVKSTTELFENLGSQITLTFKGLIQDHPYLAIARMSRSANLSVSDNRILVSTIQELSQNNHRSQKTIVPPEWTNHIPPSVMDSSLEPFQQAYELATYVRKNTKEHESISGKISVYPILYNLGYEVYDRNLPDKIHALSVWANNFGQFVVLNTSTNALAPNKNYLHRAAMAHEICHILIDKTRSRPLVDLFLSNTNDPIEKRAKAFAAEFLLPRQLALQFIEKREDKSETVDLLAWRHEVSLSIAANQLKNGADSEKISLPPNILKYVTAIGERKFECDSAESNLPTIVNKIKKLACIQSGWYDGCGNSPSEKDLDWLVENLKICLHSKSLIVPGVFPTPDGNVQIEWDLGNFQGVLEFDLRNKKANWLMFRLDKPDQEVEIDINLNVASGWDDLVRSITQLFEEATND